MDCDVTGWSCVVHGMCKLIAQYIPHLCTWVVLYYLFHSFVQIELPGLEVADSLINYVWHT